ncbi:MAG: preprotein translocase subunit SecG [Spirochaetaceae bacterium]|jgi:preprotein translocase subunit SecG|nr:preprotein translocase subunit SecG [Spirochaetaceae bacterium]
MGVLSGFLLVLFIIVAILLILIVLVQNEEGDTMGGVFGGGSNTAFGSRSGNILTKTSSVLGVLFFTLAFALALLNRSPGDSGVEAAGRQSSENSSDWFNDTPSGAAEETAVPNGVSAPAEDADTRTGGSDSNE